MDIPPARAAMENAAAKIREELESMPAFTEIKDRVSIQVTREGLRIELVDTDEQSFFGVGSADVQLETRVILAIIADKIKDMPNKVAIEGHTDSRPYGPNGGYQLAAVERSRQRRPPGDGGVWLRSASPRSTARLRRRAPAASRQSARPA